MDYRRFLVISLEMSSQKLEGKYDASEAAKWGVLSWLSCNSGNLLIDVFMQASANMVNFHLSAAFQALHLEANYLRIQDNNLSGVVAYVDIAMKKNLNDLVRTGEALLKKPVSKVDLETGRCKACNTETNEEALRRFAKMLLNERQLRLLRLPHGHDSVKFEAIQSAQSKDGNL